MFERMPTLPASNFEDQIAEEVWTSKCSNSKFEPKLFYVLMATFSVMFKDHHDLLHCDAMQCLDIVDSNISIPKATLLVEKHAMQCQ